LFHQPLVNTQTFTAIYTRTAIDDTLPLVFLDGGPVPIVTPGGDFDAQVNHGADLTVKAYLRRHVLHLLAAGKHVARHGEHTVQPLQVAE